MHLPYILNAAPQPGSYVDLATYLLERRTLFLGPELNSALASSFAMQMLALLQKEGEISIYLNCYGGSVPAGLAIADVIDYANAQNVPVHTYCLGECVGIATVILAAGTKGGRRAFPSARISLYQEWYGAESLWGAASQDDQERSRLMEIVEERLRRHTRIADRRRRDELTFSAEEWALFQARFPADSKLALLVRESEELRVKKYHLDVAVALAAGERGEIAPEIAAAVRWEAGAANLRNSLQKLEFLKPQQAVECGIVDLVAQASPGPPTEGR
jgi:ATP-dependent Clp protease protease subunit